MNRHLVFWSRYSDNGRYRIEADCYYGSGDPTSPVSPSHVPEILSWCFAINSHMAFLLFSDTVVENQYLTRAGAPSPLGCGYAALC